jgi:hypothetical protein
VSDQKETAENSLFTIAYWLVFVLFHGKTTLAPIFGATSNLKTLQLAK